MGQTATITVNDLSNSLNTSIEVKIVESPYGDFIDVRDGKDYLTIEIGTQIWMAENLNYESETGSWVYENNELNAPVYGRLYNWETSQTVCPTGWHLPSNNEWSGLVDYLGGPANAGGKLKETGTTLWKIPNSYATNESNFTALPGGTRLVSESFINLNENAFFWTSTQSDISSAYYRKLDFDRGSTSYGYTSQSAGFSIRCVKD